MHTQNRDKNYIYFVIAIISIGLLFTGCSSSSSNDALLVSLTNDADHDGLPDELESSVNDILEMTDGSVDESDADRLAGAYVNFDDSLPYSSEVFRCCGSR